MSLWSDFLNHTGRPIHKWRQYFPPYERHFSRYVDRPVTFLEIGCGEGGSLQMWKKYLGPRATIIGIDIDPRCAGFEEDQIHVRIGSQADHAFLQNVLDEFGQIDVVLDDGSHVMGDVVSSFSFLYARLAVDGVYMAEDLHTAYWEKYGGGLRRPGTFIELCKSLLDELNGDHVRPPGSLRTTFTDTTDSMHFYDSIAVFERGTSRHKGDMLMPVQPVKAAT